MYLFRDLLRIKRVGSVKKPALNIDRTTFSGNFVSINLYKTDFVFKLLLIPYAKFRLNFSPIVFKYHLYSNSLNWKCLMCKSWYALIRFYERSVQFPCKD